ncbi:dienelactone hydrolase [Bradyrhizobium tropiciagri]|uniref:dienelactone hydrolase n=1 Tax=Bradyrhizobium tropiciagri TaxID=312253 RepID=UPI001BA5D656|nr:dienelactone hydrolase [Bradyrhizobium tropiciagri]MBR0870311.1 dienelactone hydrolase [Bradyrhizobium tropiciagri]
MHGHRRAQGANSSSVEFDDKGWPCFPDREDLSAEFIRLLAAAQEGGSTVSECWLTLSRINLASEISWAEEWIKTAETNEARAELSSLNGNLITARRNWLRAIGYFHAAARPFGYSNDLLECAVDGMRRCAKNYLGSRVPAGRILSIPWTPDLTLEACYLPSAFREDAPVIVCIGEPGSYKEELIAKYASHANERGLSLLTVDLLGTRTTLSPVCLESNRFEAAMSHVLDFLSEQPGVDSSRIAIVADAWSSSLVARAAASDARFAAAVCDAGIWDLHERSFFYRHASGRGRAGCPDEPNAISRSIDCPLLVTAGEGGWLLPDSLIEFGDGLGNVHQDARLILFRRAETAAMQGHIDNPTLANEVIFDWLEDRLRLRKGLS